jgi:outer membrane protein assembly factor BamD (BamD/ComL family)
VTLRATGQVSTLPERNDLYKRAIEASNAGDVHGAVVGFEGFLARYPSGPLSEDARIHIMRLLAKVSPSQAASAARQYLAEYPKGASRDEAEGIISAAP